MTRSPSDTWIRIVNPLILISLSIVGQQLLFPPVSKDEFTSAIRLIFFIVVNYEIVRYGILFVRRKFPAISDTKMRIFASYVLAVTITLCLISVSTLVGRLFVNKPFSFWSETLINLLQSFWIAILSVAPYEVLYSYFLVLRAESEKEQLQKITIESQLHALQAQVQPHFLFNSLNTLSALTIKDSQRAEAFVIELSAVYRYLLQKSDHHLTSLKEELNFLHSFLHLLKTRFEEGLQYSIDVDPSLYTYQLPPLTLQVLVENAVKHNIFSDTEPLHLSIYIDAQKRLVVSNTLQKKPLVSHSTGFGLSNIISRYNLLNQPEVVVTEDSKAFTVVLPLLNPHYESVHR